MSGKGYFKRTPRGGARSKQLVAGVRRGMPTRSRTFKLARSMRGGQGGYKGGFIINREAVTWCFNNAAGGTTSFVATADAGFAGSSLANVGTPQLVSGAIGGLMYNVPFAIDFTLDSLAQYSDLQQISDRYQIYKVELTFWSPATSATSQNVTNVSTGGLASLPWVHWVTDNDDNNATTMPVIKSKMGLRCGSLAQGKRVTAIIYPRVAPIVQTASGTSYSVPSGPIFINTANANVQHYGIKGYFANVGLSGVGETNGSTVIMCNTKYFIKVRDLQ